MAAPRVTITDLPDKPVAAPSDLFVVQDGAVTKKMTMQHVLDATGVSDLRNTSINTALPLTGGGDLSASRTLAINTFTAGIKGAVPASIVADGTKYLRDDGTWNVPPGSGGGGGGGGLTDGDKGDIVVGLLGDSLTFDPNVVTTAARSVLDDLTTTAMLVTLGAQPADPDLTAIAALPSTTNNVIQSTAGVWTSRTPAQLKSTLALNQTDVGLDQVSNTSDSNKPVSTAQATALNAKVDKTFAIATVGPLTGGSTLAGTGITLQISNFTGTTAGAVPNPGGVTGTRYLRDDATWATVAGGGGSGPPGIVSQPTPPVDTTILWADTTQVGIEENARYLKSVTTGTYTLVLGDKGKLILASLGTAQIITVPTNASVAFITGTQIDVSQAGVGAVSIVGASGVTVNSPGGSLALRVRYSTVSLIKTATDTWLVVGDLA